MVGERSDVICVRSSRWPLRRAPARLGDNDMRLRGLFRSSYCQPSAKLEQSSCNMTSVAGSVPDYFLRNFELLDVVPEVMSVTLCDK